MSEYTTHFQGFAKLEWEKIEAYIRTYGFIPEGEVMRAEFLPPLYDLLAECAFDLAQHTLLTVPIISYEKNAEGAAFDVPDMTEWPDKS